MKCHASIIGNGIAQRGNFRPKSFITFKLYKNTMLLRESNNSSSSSFLIMAQVFESEMSMIDDESAKNIDTRDGPLPTRYCRQLIFI